MTQSPNKNMFDNLPQSDDEHEEHPTVETSAAETKPQPPTQPPTQPQPPTKSQIELNEAKRIEVVRKLTEKELHRIANSVCRFFGKEDVDGRWSSYDTRKSDPNQSICMKHVAEFVEEYVTDQHMSDFMDDPIAPSSPYFIVHVDDLPLDMKPLAAQYNEIMGKDQDYPGFVVIHLRAHKSHWDYYHSKEDEMKYTVSASLSRNISSLFDYVETYYSKYLSKNFACAGCFMSLVTLAYISRSHKVVRPARVIGLPAEIVWQKTHGLRMHEIIALVNAAIPPDMKLSAFMKRTFMDSYYGPLPSLRDWIRDVVFPEIKEERERVEKEKEAAYYRKLEQERAAEEEKQRQDRIAYLNSPAGKREKEMEERARAEKMRSEAYAKARREQEERDEAARIAADKEAEAEYLESLNVKKEHQDLASQLLHAGFTVKKAKPKKGRK